MCRALWLSRTRILALCLATLWQTLRPFEPRPYWPCWPLVFGMRAFLIACGAALFIAAAAAYLLEGLQEPASKSFSNQLCASELIGGYVRCLSRSSTSPTP